MFNKVLGMLLVSMIFASSVQSEPGYLTKFGRGSYQTDGELNFPSGIGTDSNGNVYVCEQWSHRISKFDADGNFLAKWGSVGCLGVDTDSSNNVYVVSETQHKIRKYDSEGLFLQEWGAYGSGEGQFRSPRDLAVNKSMGHVYIMDSKNYRVQVFDTDGNFLFQWGSYGSGSQQFNGAGPYGIAIDQNTNEVYVSVTGGTRISKFDQNGNYLLHWGTPGKNGGEFRWNRDIDVDGSGYVYVADTDNERIQKFDSAGNFVTSFQGLHNENDGPFHPRAVAADLQSDNIFVTASYSYRVDKFNASGNFLMTFGWHEKDGGVFNAPKGIAIDNARGYIYVPDTGNFLIQQFDFSGNFVTSWGNSARLSTIDDGGDGRFDFPSAVTTDAEGDVYVLRPDNYYPWDPELKRVQKFDQDGNWISSWNYYDFFDGMRGLVYSPYNGSFYVVNSWEHKVHCFDGNGSFLFEFGGYGSADGQFDYPTRISVNPNNGNVYVIDHRNSRIQKFSSAGNFLTKFGQNGTGNGDLKLGVNSGIHVDGDGYVYVTDTGNSRIQVFDAYGVYVTKWGHWGGGYGNFIYPQGVVVDSSGYIYVVDSGLNYIQKFTPVCDDNIVRITGPSPAYYSSIQAAYDAALDGDTIQCQAKEFDEDLIFDLNKTIALEGGYNCAFSSVSGLTELDGDLDIANGMISIDNFSLD